MKCRYWTIFAIAAVLFLTQVFYSSTKLNQHNSGSPSSLKVPINSKEVIPYAISSKISSYGANCYKALQRDVCKNFNGLYFNSTTFSEESMAKFENRVRVLTRRNTTFYGICMRI